MRRFALCCLLAAFAAGSLFSQSSGQAGSGAPASTAPEPYKASEFPLWARELRRFEIISIGVLPFGVFSSTLAFDLCRFLGGKSIGFAIANLGSANPFLVSDVPAFDIAYAPWPVKSATSYVTSSDEKALILISAVTVSLLVGLADFIILKVRERAELRKKAAVLSRVPIPEPLPPEPGQPEPPEGSEPGAGGADEDVPEDTATGEMPASTPLPGA